MSITEAAYQQILREYDEKQLAALRGQRLRAARIEEDIPQLTALNSHITGLAADMAVMRIRGLHSDANELERMEAQRKSLIERRNTLLRDAGYSLKDFEPVYECDICNDTGYVGNEMCRCLKSRIVEVLYDQSNIRDILERENFGTYTLKYYSDTPLDGREGESPLSIARQALECAMDFIRNFDTSADNLLISGETGTGKTFLCNCIAKAVLDNSGSVLYLSAVKLFNTLAAETFSANKGESAGLHDIYGCDLLIIDDLGTEFSNAFTLSSFFNCVNERLLRGKHTIISTNLSLERIREDYSERVFSRIAEKYIFIKLFGGDIRIIKKLEE